jgi:hypothetical protein
MTGIKKNDDCRKGVAARKRKVATKEVERHRSREDGNRETQMRGAPASLSVFPHLFFIVHRVCGVSYDPYLNKLIHVASDLLVYTIGDT